MNLKGRALQKLYQFTGGYADTTKVQPTFGKIFTKENMVRLNHS
jgi:hypothetical protein